MRAVVQRVTASHVSTEGEITGRTGPGLLVLLGVETGDNSDDVAWLASKIVNMRIFNDSAGVMNLSLLDTGQDILVISQFTLHASTRKGNRPSYIRAARPDEANELYQLFIQITEGLTGRKVATGRFGAMMQVSLVNNGPVTIIIDSRIRE